MKVFVAGASGAIGRPLIAELIRKGHTVTGMTHSEAGARRLRELGVDVAIANALDADAVETALGATDAEAVIDELTLYRRLRRSFRRMRLVTKNCGSRAGGICTVLLLPAAYAVTSSSRVDFFLMGRARWPMRVRHLL